MVRKKRRGRGQTLQTLLEPLTFSSSCPTPPLLTHLSPAIYTVDSAPTLARLQTPPQLRPFKTRPTSRTRPAPYQSRCRCWETHLRGWRGGEASGALGALTGPCPPRGGPGRSARWLASPVEVD